MKVCIDHQRCQGHTMCYLLSPQLFEISAEDGKGLVRFDPVPPELEDAAQRAAESCPEEAITIIR